MVPSYKNSVPLLLSHVMVLEVKASTIPGILLTKLRAFLARLRVR
jgi:predicted nucleotidyltransferase